METPTPPPTGEATSLAIGPQLVRVIELAHGEKLAVLLEGPTGVGKSEIVERAAEELGIQLVILDLSLLEPPDLIGIPYVEDGVTRYAAPSIMPREGRGILMLEELNRSERYLQQAALQLLTARRLHEYELPPEWSMVAAINPENGEYNVNPLDRALRARFLQLRVRADVESWLAWAQESGIHPAILRLARLHDRMLADVPPRTWTYASRLLHALQGAGADASTWRSALAGYLPGPWLELLLQQTVLEDEDADEELEASLLLRLYHESKGLRRRLQGLVRGGRTDRVDRLYRSLYTTLASAELGRLIRADGVSLEALEQLLGDLPGDLREGLQEAFGGNPEAADLLPFDADAVLGGYRARSRMRRELQGWVLDGRLRHRARALATAVRARLREHPDLAALRGDRRLRGVLAQLVDDLGGQGSAELGHVIEDLQLALAVTGD